MILKTNFIVLIAPMSQWADFPRIAAASREISISGPIGEKPTPACSTRDLQQGWVAIVGRKPAPFSALAK